MEVHAALRRAGRARGEGDDRDVVGGRVDGLERPARGQLLDARARRSSRHLARQLARGERERDPRLRRHLLDLARAQQRHRRHRRSRPRAGCPASTAIASGVFGACSSTRVAGLDLQRRGDRRRARRAARRSSSRRRSPSPSCASSSTAAFTRSGPSSSSRSGQASGGGRWSRANVSVIAAPPGR